MNETWLEISGEDIDVEDIMRQIRARVTERQAAGKGDVVPERIASDLWRETIGEATDIYTFNHRYQIWNADCDMVPRDYVIDWRIPILGPIHAIVRRVINAEIRRYLLRSLDRQSKLNQKLVVILRDLARENMQLHSELEALREQFG